MKFKYLMIDGDGSPFAIFQYENTNDKQLHLYDYNGVLSMISQGLWSYEFELAAASIVNYRSTRNVEL